MSYLPIVLAEPLRGLGYAFQSVCVADCCGLEAFDISADAAAGWWAPAGPAGWAALDQLSDLIQRVKETSPPFTLELSPDRVCWYDAADCTAWLRTWCHALHAAVTTATGRPLFDPAWRTPSAVALATTIYEQRAFDRLPILADAIEEAGCDQPDVLRHCREGVVHARGCWVVDGVLGKA